MAVRGAERYMNVLDSIVEDGPLDYVSHVEKRRLNAMIAKINPDLEVMCRMTGDLKSDPNNVRKHSERNILAIAESLMQYGQQKPIVVKNNVVLAGNGTLEAAKRLGWEKIACTEFSGDGKAQGYALADNRTAELAEWDFEKLTSQLGLFENQMELQYLWSSDELSTLKSLNAASTAGSVGLTPDQKKTIFESNTIKQIVLYLDDVQYKEVLTKFKKIAETNELLTNTEVVLALLTFYENPTPR
jgi:ParB-like nuclease family protein